MLACEMYGMSQYITSPLPPLEDSTCKTIRIDLLALVLMEGILLCLMEHVAAEGGVAGLVMSLTRPSSGE